MRRSAWAFALVMAGLPAWAGADTGAAGEGIAARLGATELETADLLKLISFAPAPERRALRDHPDALAAVARREVLREAVLAEARREGFDKRPEVAANVARSAEQALVDLYLNSKASVPAGYPDPKAIEAAYKNNPESFQVAARVHLAHILIPVKLDADKETAGQIGARARSVAEQARVPLADFSRLALKYSEDPASKSRGGDIGWVPDAGLLPAVRGAISMLSAGGISDPVRTPAGWQIFKLIDHQAAHSLSLKEAEPGIAQALRAQKANEQKEAWLSALRARGITVDSAALAGVRAKIP